MGSLFGTLALVKGLEAGRQAGRRSGDQRRAIAGKAARTPAVFYTSTKGTWVVHPEKGIIQTAKAGRQRRTIVDGVRPLTCVLHKYKRYMGSTCEKGIIQTAKTGRQRRTIVDGVRPLTCILHKYKRYMGSTSEKGIIKTAKAGRRRWCTAVDLYFTQVQKVHG